MNEAYQFPQTVWVEGLLNVPPEALVVLSQWFYAEYFKPL